METPAELRRPWLRVVRRIESVARRHDGMAVVTIRVLVDSSGLPINWAEPLITRLEPRVVAEDALRRALKLVPKDEWPRLLELLLTEMGEGQPIEQ